MISIFKGSTDISAGYKRNTLTITEYLNNKRNIANFKTNNYKIDEGSLVYIYDTVNLRSDYTQQYLSWENTEAWNTDAYTWEGAEKARVNYEEIDEWSATWKVGDTIIVDIKGDNESKFTITEIDTDNDFIRLNKPAGFTITKDMLCGRLLFAGVCVKPNEIEVGNQNFYEYHNQINDWQTLFDAKGVNTTFLSMYPREMMGRVIYEKTMDSEVVVDSLDAAFTESGVALSMSNESTDKLEGTNSQKTGTSGAGTAKWSKTITSADLSDYENLRFWWKIAAGEGTKISSLKVMIGTDSSNYFEWSIDNIGSNYEDCWNYESIELPNADETVGAPDLSAIIWIQFEIVSSDAISTGEILFDEMKATTGGFTIKNVERGTAKFEEFKVPDKKPAEFVNDMVNRLSMFWYIDYERDIHMFQQNSSVAPFNLTETSQNFRNLTITRDIEKLVNRQTVLGGEAASNSLYEQITIADGEETSFGLDYNAKNLRVYVEPAAGGGYVEKTVGIEGLDAEGTFDFITNFESKIVRNDQFATLASGDKIKRTYNPFLPVKVRVQSQASINRMKALIGGDGIFDGRLIEDASLVTNADCRLRAQAEIDQYGNALVNVQFITEQEGLHAGQLITITDTSRNLNAEEFLIQSVKIKDGERFEYSITAGTTLLGLTEFFQLMLKRTDTVATDTNQQVDTVLNHDETVSIADAYTFTTLDESFEVSQLLEKSYMFNQLSNDSRTSDHIIGTGIYGSNWFVKFIGSETGTGSIGSSNYESGKELKLVAETGGSGNEVRAHTVRRLAVSASKEHTVTAWFELLNDLTNVSSGGVKLEIKEYDAAVGGNLLATNTIFDEKIAKQNFDHVTDTFTTNASTTHIQLVFSLYQASGSCSLGRVKIVESGTDAATNPARAGFSQATT